MNSVLFLILVHNVLLSVFCFSSFLVHNALLWFLMLNLISFAWLRFIMPHFVLFMLNDANTGTDTGTSAVMSTQWHCANANSDIMP